MQEKLYGPELADDAFVVDLIDAATVDVDASAGNNSTTWRLAIGGNRTLGNPTRARDSQRFLFEIISDGSARTLAFDTKYQGSDDLALASIVTSGTKTYYLLVVYNLAADKFRQLSINKGFA